MAVDDGVGAAIGTTGDAWEAGYEMGRLGAQLAARPVRVRVGLTIRAVNRGPAGVLARRHGYELHSRDGAEAGSLWVEFWPLR